MDAGYIAGVFGLIGAAIGAASSIVAMVIQAKMKDKRDRSKQLIDLSMAQFKMNLDLATSGKGPPNVLPPSAFLYHNDLMLKAYESGAAGGGVVAGDPNRPPGTGRSAPPLFLLG